MRRPPDREDSPRWLRCAARRGPGRERVERPREPHQSVGLLEERVELGAVGGQHTVAHGLEIALEVGERRAQLVCRIPDEPVADGLLHVDDAVKESQVVLAKVRAPTGAELASKQLANEADVVCVRPHPHLPRQRKPPMNLFCIGDLTGKHFAREVCRPHTLLLVDEQDLVRALGADPVKLGLAEVI